MEAMWNDSLFFCFLKMREAEHVIRPGAATRRCAMEAMWNYLLFFCFLEMREEERRQYDRERRLAANNYFYVDKKYLSVYNKKVRFRTKR